MNNTSTSPLEDEVVPHRDLYMAFTIVLFIFGMLGNTLVIVVIGKRSNRSIHDMFILNLAAADILFILLVLPLYGYKLYASYYEDEFFCRVIFLLQTIGYFIGIFTITSMAIYRCYVILHPYKRAKLTSRTGWLVIGLIWLVSFIIVLPIAVVNTSINGQCKELWWHESHSKIYTAALFVLQFLLPLTIIAVAYTRIGIFLLRQKVPQTSLGSTKNDPKREKRRRENKQVITTLAAIVIIFTICLLPGQIAWMVDHFDEPDDRRTIDVVYKVSTILDFTHACANPVIYALLTDRFRKAYIEVFTKVITCGRASITPDLESSMNMHPPESNDSKGPDGTEENILSDDVARNRASHYEVEENVKLDYKL